MKLSTNSINNLSPGWLSLATGNNGFSAIIQFSQSFVFQCFFTSMNAVNIVQRLWYHHCESDIINPYIAISIRLDWLLASLALQDISTGDSAAETTRYASRGANWIWQIHRQGHVDCEENHRVSCDEGDETDIHEIIVMTTRLVSTAALMEEGVCPGEPPDVQIHWEGGWAKGDCEVFRSPRTRDEVDLRRR